MKKLLFILSLLIVSVVHAQQASIVFTVPVDNTNPIVQQNQLKDTAAALRAAMGSSGGGAVNSFNGRTGSIVPQLSDYSAYFATLSHTHVIGDVTGLQSAINNKQDLLPSQTGNSGKYLTTNGSGLSWGTATGSGAITNNLTTNSSGTSLDAQQGYILKGLIDGNASSISGKQATLVSGTNIKTINGTSLLGSGDIAISGGGTIDATPTSSSTNAVQSGGVYTALQSKANTSSLATVATTGAYIDLLSKPAIPAQVNITGGTGISISGAYPNLTITNTGGVSSGASMPRYAINAEAADYTAQISDTLAVVLMTANTSANFTIPNNSNVAFNVGQQITVVQAGIGQITYVAASGVTVNSADSATKSRVQYSSATLIKTGTNIWYLMGDIIP